MTRARAFVVALAATAAVGAVARHIGGAGSGHHVPGGILIGDARAYDSVTRLVLGSFHRRIAADIAAGAPSGARVLEVGCGPGHLSIRLARRYGLEVTGVDLDPAMIERARANCHRAGAADLATFRVGDVAAMPFNDESVDLVVSTLSMHHWADPAAAMAEVGRVLRPGGRALIWDFRPGAHPFAPTGRSPAASPHAAATEPLELAAGSQLRVRDVTPWPWPWTFRLTERIEFVRDEPSAVAPDA